MATLEEELSALSPELAEELARYHFDATLLVKLSRRLLDLTLADNRVKGVSALLPGDLCGLPEPGAAEAERLRQRGLTLLRAGSSALIVLAGGMATRMGGVVKALVPALPGRTFLSLRLAERALLEREVGHEVPLWFMTSAATDGKIRVALGDELDGYRTAVFPQALSLRLTREGQLFRDARGEPSPHARGHGYLVDALRGSGLLDLFASRGGRTLTVGNLDNLGATLDPLLIGFHADRGRPVTCEVVDKLPTDRGGIPARLGGRPVVLEEFRFPVGFDLGAARVFSTNTFHFDVESLARVSVPGTYFAVEKRVAGRPAIQFERLINEITNHLETQYVRVPRRGSRSRFLPVKDDRELAARQHEIEAVVSARGTTA